MCVFIVGLTFSARHVLCIGALCNDFAFSRFNQAEANSEHQHHGRARRWWWVGDLVGGGLLMLGVVMKGLECNIDVAVAAPK